MPSRVLLISANRCTTPDAVFPLGLACLSGALREAGHECVWLDYLADAPEMSRRIAECKPDFAAISLRNIDDILIRRKETFFESLASLSDVVRSHHKCPVIVGGSGFSIFPRELFELSGADYGIAGEGEASLVALIRALETGAGYRSIPGLVYRQDGTVFTNASAPGRSARPLGDEDRPARLANHYLSASQVLNAQTQRGCAYKCCYCTYPLIEGKAHRRRPAGAVAEELEQIQRLGGRHVFIVDSVFNSSPKHVTEVCEAILARKVKLSWGCFLRPQHLTTGLMKLMARAGLSHIEFGADSFCDEVLAAYGKGLTFEDILESSELAAREKVAYCHFLISGGPGETVHTLRKGFENSLRLPGPVIMAVAGMRIYPGTDLFERAVTEGRVARNANLLEPVYYLAPGLTEETVFAELKHFARQSPAWIVGDPVPGYLELMERLRKKGVVGPLWSYFPIVQRLWPQATSSQ